MKKSSPPPAKKLGRPKLPKKALKSDRFPLHLTEENKRLIADAAGRENRKPSSWARETLLQVAEHRMAGPGIHLGSAFDAALANLNKNNPSIYEEVMAGIEKIRAERKKAEK